MGKAEGRDEQWHGHVTAVSVAPEFRRCGLAAVFMDGLERISEAKRCYFVDLFVRVSNETACRMYRQLGYIVYRRIIDYYSSGSGGADGPKGGEGPGGGKDEEDAFGKQRYYSSAVRINSLAHSRYAQGSLERRGKEVGCPTQTANQRQ